MKKINLKIKLPKINITLVILIVTLLIISSSLFLIFRQYHVIQDNSKLILQYIDKVSLNKIDINLTENVIEKLNNNYSPIIDVSEITDPFKKIEIEKPEEE
ncbi:hypothetical protein HOE31_01435 [bacterium]|jgi:hypothetical protein|nr:hypothetical protein [bacterium]MBT4121591.1 hypothetical protein [bacterium]MBT4335097.1 hypothetical protein [bacterium]MBT4764089.1 hypothetical protein [bacterium]MBT5401461.1 hypothetical protein [bacterium]